MAVSVVPFSLFAKSSPHAGRNQIDFATFLSKRGTVFTASPGSGALVIMELIEVEQTVINQNTAEKAIDAGHEKFSLLFQSPAGQALEQDTYTFEHPELGRFDMFIVPISVRGNNDNYYEAIFNRPPLLT